MVKSTYPLNFTRSAKAPRIKAGVMRANMHWNIAKVSSGMPVGMMASKPMPWRKHLSKPPMTQARGLPESAYSVENAQE